MARTKRQYENEIRTVVVGKVATEFRKAKLVSRVIQNATNNNQIVTGSLVSPEKSGSITPSSDDKWLIDKDSVRVEVLKLDKDTGIPTEIRIEVDIDYGINFKYWWLSKESPGKVWRPSGWQLMDWVERKMSRGEQFYIMNPNGTRRPAQQTAMDRNRVAFAISRSIGKKGINKTNLTDPFFKGNENTAQVLRKGFDKALDRVAELYEAYMTEGFDNATFDLM